MSIFNTIAFGLYLTCNVLMFFLLWKWWKMERGMETNPEIKDAQGPKKKSPRHYSWIDRDGNLISSLETEGVDFGPMPQFTPFFDDRFCKCEKPPPPPPPCPCMEAGVKVDIG